MKCDRIKSKERQVTEVEEENREYKDSIFVDLFYKDVTAKKNLLSLYNAYTIQIIRMKR